MSRAKDTLSGDLFMIPRAVLPNKGALACRPEISGLIGDALKGSDRFEVAAEMTKLLGREVSKHMIDAWAAESREDQMLPFDTAIAFDMAVGSHTLLDFAAQKLGARVSIGKDALHTQLGKLERTRDEATKQIKQLKSILGEAE